MTKKNSIYTKKNNFKIYIIIFPSDEFYIGTTTQDNLKSAFKDHYNLRRSLTKELMQQAKNDQVVPDMFFLEEFYETKNKVFSRLVAWAKLICECTEYKCANGETFNSYIEDLIPLTEKYYEDIRQTDLYALLNKEKSITANYKPRQYQHQPQHRQISISFTREEFESVEKQAQKAGMSKSAYTKMRALRPNIPSQDSSIYREQLKQIREGIATMQQTIVTIYRMGQYFPQDIQKIENFANLVVEHYNQIVEINRKTYKTHKKIDRSGK